MPSAPVIVRPCVLLMRIPALAGSAQTSSAMARAVACRNLVGTVLRNIFRALGLLLRSTLGLRRGLRAESTSLARFQALELDLNFVQRPEKSCVTVFLRIHSSFIAASVLNDLMSSSD